MAKVSIKKLPINTILLEVFKKSVTPVLEEETETYAAEIAEKLKRKIRNNEFDFSAKYNRDYLVRKLKKQDKVVQKGESLESLENKHVPLYDTGQYERSIGVERRGNMWVVGVVNDRVHEGREAGESVPMLLIARTMEFGSPERNIPARPHWRPVLTEVRKEHDLIARKWTKRMNQEANKTFKKYLNSFDKNDFEYTWRTNK